MDWAAVVGLAAILFTGISGIIGYWVNQLSKNQDTIIADQKTLAKDLQELEIKIPEKYVLKEDLNNRLDKIEMVLDKISDKIDSKADK